MATPDLSARGERLDWSQSNDLMSLAGPPEVEAVQTGSTIRCQEFRLQKTARRMEARGEVKTHFVDEPAEPGKRRTAAPRLPGARRKEGEKQEADLTSDRQEFTWREDGPMETLVALGTVLLVSGGTRAEGRSFVWNATEEAGTIEDVPVATVVSTPEPTEKDPAPSPAVFRARRIRFDSSGRVVLQGRKRVEMQREVFDAEGQRKLEPVVIVCERDLVLKDQGKEIHLEKDVQVTGGGTTIRCDEMLVTTDPDTNQVRRMMAWGHVRYRSEDGLAVAKQLVWEQVPDPRDPSRPLDEMNLRSLPPATLISPEALFYAEHIRSVDHGKRMEAENYYGRRDIWLRPGGKK